MDIRRGENRQNVIPLTTFVDQNQQRITINQQNTSLAFPEVSVTNGVHTVTGKQMKKRIDLMVEEEEEIVRFL